MPFKPQCLYMWLIINYLYGVLMYWCIDLCHLEDKSHCSEPCTNLWRSLESLQTSYRHFPMRALKNLNTESPCIPPAIMSRGRNQVQSFWIRQLLHSVKSFQLCVLQFVSKQPKLFHFLHSSAQNRSGNIPCHENAEFHSGLQLFTTPCF